MSYLVKLVMIFLMIKVLNASLMVAVTDSELRNQQYCIRDLPSKLRAYGQATDYFKNSDDSPGSFGNCMAESNDGGNPPVT